MTQFTSKTYAAISEICESISFIYIGVAFYGFGIESEAAKLFGVGSVAIVIIIVIAARIVNVAVCSGLLRHYFNTRVPLNHQVLIVVSGLRGAMSSRGLTSFRLRLEVTYIAARHAGRLHHLQTLGHSLLRYSKLI